MTLAAISVDFRTGKLMLFGVIFCCLDSALTVVTCLSYKSQFVMPFAKKKQAGICKRELLTGNSSQLKVSSCWAGICQREFPVIGALPPKC
jgi:HrpA-like RNA helicase